MKIIVENTEGYSKISFEKNEDETINNIEDYITQLLKASLALVMSSLAEIQHDKKAQELLIIEYKEKLDQLIVLLTKNDHIDNLFEKRTIN